MVAPVTNARRSTGVGAPFGSVLHDGSALDRPIASRIEVRRSRCGSGSERADARRIDCQAARVPALDGLRGVAVAAVVANHVAPRGFRGGWLGVDIFFVLSGYLITSILLSEFSATGRIDLRHFYARRARRLLPALIALLLVVSVVARLAPHALGFGDVRGDGASAVAMALEYGAAAHVSRAYFGTDTHAHGLLLGRALGVLARYKMRVPFPRVVAVLGLVGIAVAFGGGGYDDRGRRERRATVEPPVAGTEQ